MDSRIEHFSFWRPVSFVDVAGDDENLGQTPFKKILWNLGRISDEFAYLGSNKLIAKAERIDGYKIYFEEEEEEDISITAQKVALYILSFGLLPLAALLVKIAFKIHLNACRTLTKTSPNEVLLEKDIGNTKIVLLKGDLTEETTDVIVNAANKGLWAGGGVCGAIHTAAGDGPFAECNLYLKEKKIKQLKCGQAILTGSGDLYPRVKAIAHAVGPDFRDKKDKKTGKMVETLEKKNGKKLLKDAYQNSLQLLLDSDQSLRSIAFPSISTGIFDAPLDIAVPVALQTVKKFIEKNPDALEEVRFVFLPPPPPKSKRKSKEAKAPPLDATMKKFMDELKKL